jgi:hypothetical protein
LSDEPPVHQEIAARGTIQPANQMHQGALTGPARSHYGDERTFGNFQGNTREGGNIVVALAIGFANVDAADHSMDDQQMR